MARAMGLIAFESDRYRIKGISNHRPLMSASFLGRYRLMDFPISNLSNSGVNTIHVYVKEKPRSVFEHVGTGRHYNINSKHGRLRVMYGESEISSSIYNTDVMAYHQNRAYIMEDVCEYIIIAPAHFTYVQDFKDVMDKHIDSGADITVLYKNCDHAKEKFLGCSTLTFDGNRIVGHSINHGQAKQRNISLETYVLKKSLFYSLIDSALATSSIYWFSDILFEKINQMNVLGYRVKSEALASVDLKSYFDSNMCILKSGDFKMFNSAWPIYTRTNDSSPTQYGKKSVVVNSLIANGCVINGTVKNSIIGRGVVVDEGSVLENCIVLPSTTIGKNIRMEYAVVDKHVRVEKTKSIIGSYDNLIYLNRHDQL